MKKSSKKFIEDRLEVVTDLLQEIAERLEKLEAKVIHEIRVSDGVEYPWEGPSGMGERIEASECQFEEETSPSSPTVADPPELVPQTANDGQTQSNSDDGKSKTELQ